MITAETKVLPDRKGHGRTGAGSGGDNTFGRERLRRIRHRVVTGQYDRKELLDSAIEKILEKLAS